MRLAVNGEVRETRDGVFGEGDIAHEAPAVVYSSVVRPGPAQ